MIRCNTSPKFSLTDSGICVCVSGGGARARWKALKAESRTVVEETENVLRTLQDRVQQVHDRRNTLTQLVQQLGSQVISHTFTHTYTLRCILMCTLKHTELEPEPAGAAQK